MPARRSRRREAKAYGSEQVAHLRQSHRALPQRGDALPDGGQSLSAIAGHCPAHRVSLWLGRSVVLPQRAMAEAHTSRSVSRGTDQESDALHREQARVRRLRWTGLTSRNKHHSTPTSRWARLPSVWRIDSFNKGIRKAMHILDVG